MWCWLLINQQINPLWAGLPDYDGLGRGIWPSLYHLASTSFVRAYGPIFGKYPVHIYALSVKRFPYFFSTVNMFAQVNINNFQEMFWSADMFFNKNWTEKMSKEKLLTMFWAIGCYCQHRFLYLGLKLYTVIHKSLIFQHK